VVRKPKPKRKAKPKTIGEALADGTLKLPPVDEGFVAELKKFKAITDRLGEGIPAGRESWPSWPSVAERRLAESHARVIAGLRKPKRRREKDTTSVEVDKYLKQHADSKYNKLSENGACAMVAMDSGVPWETVRSRFKTWKKRNAG
jgi:hypothetical protein